jgi:glycosyltransferase involved in cell wall biosynthesis
MVVRNGVDQRLISSIKCGIDYSPMRIVAPGRLFKVKGHRLILKAFKEVLRAYPYAKLVIAGIGPEDTSLRQLSVSLGISNAVDFAGWLPRESLWQLIADSAMAVFASDGTQEGFGLALAEAAFLRTPIVASHIGAFREVLAHSDKAASWFSPDSIGELAEALKTAFERTKEDIEQQTSTAYAMAIQRASQSAMTEKYSRLYEQILCQLPTRDDMDVE